jgi:AcrR family transcriptional regulator
MVDVAGQRGCAAPSVGLVVAQAGMSRRTFYECFDGREACVLALLDLGLERIGGLVGRRLCGRTRDRTGCAWRWRRLIRRSSRNVTRWQSGDMCLRWTAAGMLEAEIQFRKVVGYAELAKLAVERDLRASTPPHGRAEPPAALRPTPAHTRTPFPNAKHKLTNTHTTTHDRAHMEGRLSSGSVDRPARGGPQSPTGSPPPASSPLVQLVPVHSHSYI